MNNVAINILKAPILTIILIFINIDNCEARNPAPPQLSEEDKAIQRESELRKTPLKIGSDCEPTSWATILNLKTLNDNQTKYFWLGQRYAVERTYKEKLEQYRLMQINKNYDEEIAALERKRDAINLESYGIKQYQSARLNSAIENSERTLNNIQNKIEKANQNWAEKCYKITDERSR